MLLPSILLVLSVANAFNLVKHIRVANPSAVPQEWKDDHESSVTNKANPTSYLVISEFIGSSTCSNVSDLQTGTGLGVCMSTSSVSSTM